MKKKEIDWMYVDKIQRTIESLERKLVQAQIDWQMYGYDTDRYEMERLNCRINRLQKEHKHLIGEKY